MFYRVVLQGFPSGDHDLPTVKREFARVTGMPQDVTERLFAQAPHSLKERLSQADAERIAATLRAIGATVTVERDLLASLEDAEGGVHEVLPPAHPGPPTIVPGSAPAPEPAPTATTPRWVRRVRPYLYLLLGALVVGALVFYLLPLAKDAYRAWRPAPAPPVEPAKPRPAETPEPPEVPAVRASAIHGPWRCTDQHTGVPVYWTFSADGSLIYHGNTLKDAPERVGDPDIPNGWRLADGRLVFTFPQASAVAYTVTDLNLTRLHYTDNRNLDILCRRP